MPDHPKIAAVTTICFKNSHTQHMVDRLLEGYGWDGQYYKPHLDLVSWYVAQIKDDDLSWDRAERYSAVRMCKSIREALTLGGEKLAVDGVMLIGEHGDYETNEKGQKLYPRYDMFMEIVEVFKKSGRSVPVFNDKHLSYDWNKAKQMYDVAQEMRFAFMAGSSLPFTRRLPPIDVPWGAKLDEALCVYYGGMDAYDIHALEAMQSMVERRAGGETGVKWLRTYTGDRFWEAHDKHVWSHDLFKAALSRSDNLNLAEPGHNYILPTFEDVQRMAKEPIAYHYQHHDGLKCTAIMLDGLILDFDVATRLKDSGEILSTQFFLPMPRGNCTNQANFFNPQIHAAEQMYRSGKPPFPLERTLLTTGLTAAGVDSLYEGQKQIDTPHLAIAYESTRESIFQRH